MTRYHKDTVKVRVDKYQYLITDPKILYGLYTKKILSPPPPPPFYGKLKVIQENRTSKSKFYFISFSVSFRQYIFIDNKITDCPDKFDETLG